jgi:hypothetical protein
MKKKTIKKKGGNSIISNIIGNKTGPFIPENLNTEIDLGNQNVIINKYKRIKEDAENEYIDAENRLNKSANESINAAKRFQIFIKNILGPFIHTLINYFAIVISFMWDKILVKFVYILKYLFENFVAFFKYIYYIFRDLIKARGVILVLFVLIATIILIIYAFYGGNMPNPFKGNPILQNTKNQITKFKENIPDSPYSILSNQLQNLIPIPDEYKNQFNKFKNDFYNFFGKDIITDDSETTLRETTDIGSYDGIYHIINNNNIEDINVYSVIKPKGPIILYAKTDSNVDYHKLPASLKVDDKYNLNNYNISIPLNSNNGKYYYDIENADYVKNGSTAPPIKSINTGNTNPFITSNVIDPLNNKISTYYNIRQIPIEKYLFSDKDNLNSKIFKQKIFNYNAETSKYEYPRNYINSNI